MWILFSKYKQWFYVGELGKNGTDGVCVDEREAYTAYVFTNLNLKKIIFSKL